MNFLTPCISVNVIVLTLFFVKLVLVVLTLIFNVICVMPKFHEYVTSTKNKF